MVLNVQSLFSDLIETPRQAQQRQLQEGLLRAQQVTSGLRGLAATQAPLAGVLAQNIGQRQEALRQNLGGMLGLDIRSEGQKIQDALKGLDLGNMDSARATAKELQNLGLSLQAAQILQLADSNIAQREAQDRELTIAEQRADTQQQQVELGEQELSFNESAQEDLVEWRNQQVAEKERDRVLKREELQVQQNLAALEMEELDSRTRAALRTSSERASELYEETEQTKQLAQEFRAAEISGDYQPGLAGQIMERWKSITGTQDEISILRTRFNKVINAATMDGLPPGAASDKDIALARQGFPDETYSAEQIASYLAGMQKLSFVAAERENERGKFLAQNKGSPVMIDSQTGAAVSFEDFYANKIKSPQYLELLEEKSGLNFLDESEMAEINQQQVTLRQQLEAEQQQQLQNRTQRSQRRRANRSGM